MLEERKQKEVEYYEKRAEDYLKEEKLSEGDFEGFNSLILYSYKFCYALLAKNCPNKRVLDYGCGNGIHAVEIAKMGADVIRN